MKKLLRWQKNLLGMLIALLLAIAGGIIYIKLNIYTPSSTASAIDPIKVTKDYELFTSEQADRAKEKTNLIFYPGALVEPASYRIWAQEVANAGYRVYILKLPFDLAVMAPNKANAVVKSHEKNILGGHSLGGVMASRYAHNHQQEISGMIFLASYPDEKGSLAKSSFPVLSITASKDQVLNHKQYQKAKNYLPKMTTYDVIKGGNHAGFGSYGAQKGDGQATISNRKQQKEIGQIIIHWLQEIN